MARVLMVDDEVVILELMEEMIKACGSYDVKTASTVKAALQYLSQEKYDILLTDINLGVETGYDLIDEMYMRGIRIPTITISGNGSKFHPKAPDTMVPEDLRDKILDHFDKPIQLVDLENCLKKYAP